MSAHAGQTAADDVALQDLRATVDRVERVLVDLDNGAHASSGRDFGRGVAYAARLIADALHPVPAAQSSPDAGDR